MPKLLFARRPLDEKEARQLQKLAGSRHAPGDWIRRAGMIVRSWAGKRTTTIAQELGCHPQTVRERIIRFNAEGLDGLSDRPGSGRKPRLTEPERGGAWMGWHERRARKGSRWSGARFGASCAKRECGGGIPGVRQRAVIPRLSQKSADRRPLHESAGRGDDPLPR